MSSRRMTRDELYLALASLISKRSTCARASVGAVLTLDGRVISTGYNGAPRGLPSCHEVGCLVYGERQEQRCLRTIHAEANAIAAANSKQGCTLYVTHHPCVDCLKLCMAAGIVKIVHLMSYHKKSLSHYMEKAPEWRQRIEIIKSPMEATPERFVHELLSIEDCAARLLDRAREVSS